MELQFFSFFFRCTKALLKYKKLNAIRLTLLCIHLVGFNEHMLLRVTELYAVQTMISLITRKRIIQYIHNYTKTPSNYYANNVVS